jgi:hypothetical protein
MVNRIGRWLTVCGLGLSALISPTSPSFAGGYIPVGGISGPIALTCENGRTYPLRARALSDLGEIVTGYLVVSQQSIHVRLIPMGDGYRYAGRGIWFDGKRDVAILYFGENNPTNCTIVREGDEVIAVKG